MKSEGIVEGFDGYYGNIIDNNTKESYLLMHQEIMGEESIINGDIVEYNPEVYERGAYKRNVARFVRKLEREDTYPKIFDK